MNLRKYILLALGLSMITCTKDEPNETIEIDNPVQYTFARDGASTVSFSGQTTRILMAEELATAMKDFSKTEDELLNMFSNTDNPFSDSDLNASTKSVKSKVAASTDFFSSNTAGAAAVKAQLENWIINQVSEVSPASQQVAEAGVAGQIADGSSTRYVNAKGLEYNQAFAKSLIGALMADQMLNNYLSPAVLDAGTNVADNDAGTTADGKPYTNMEHKWDEAYGYLFGTSASESDPLAKLGDDSFLNKYLSRVNDDPDFNTIAEDIYEALKLGRAAIVAGDYKVRDEQAAIVRELVSTVIGVRSVYYLQQGKKALASGDMGSAFHDLSEGYGFVYSLQFTREPDTTEPYFNAEEVAAYLADLDAGDGFWDLETSKLDEISAAIADRFNFSLEEAAE